MKRILAVFVLMLAVSALVYTEVQAQALQLAKPFTGKVNKAIASTLGKRMNTLGFASNDPIYGATLAAAETVVAGSIAAGSVAATVAAVGSSPVWLSVALGIGAAYEIYDFSVGQFEFKGDPLSNTVKVASGTVTIAPPLPVPFDGVLNTLPVGLPYDYADPGVGNSVSYPNDQKICATVTATYALASTYCANTVQEIEDQAKKKYYHSVIKKMTVDQPYIITSNVPGTTSGPTKTVCTLSPIDCPEAIRYNYFRNFTTNYSYQGTPYNIGTSYGLNVFNNPKFVDTNKAYSLNDAAAKLQDFDLATRADPEILAAIANKLWQQAAQQPGYQGAPYNPSDPVTAEDVLADVLAGLYPHPTNYDLLSLPSPDSATVPQLDPEAVPLPEAVPEGSVTVDLGSDPGISSPGLEDAPTGVSIVGHVMGLLPSLSNFSVPAHASTCEPPSFDFYGSTYTMQSMCDLLEGQRDVLSVLFSLTWGVVSLGIVLRA